jgi:glutamate dehydrogenase/leucine dehydrogenase
MNLWQLPPDAVIQLMKEHQQERAFVVTNPTSGELQASHPFLQSVVEALQADTRDYQEHQGMFFEIGSQSDHLLGAFIHRTIRGQAAGGVRLWHYHKLEDYIRDGLRLSRGMGQKCALAGLWWGGGKGVIARYDGKDYLDPELRRAIYQDYGYFLSGLRGCYVTAEDAGTTPEDMAHIFSTTRHTTCIPPQFGGSGNPSILTATGVVVAIEAALEYLGYGTLEGKTIVMQGIGNVSYYMIAELLKRKVANIIGSDISVAAIEKVKKKYSTASLDLRVVEQGDNSILKEACDVLIPNAMGGTLNSNTIPAIQAKVVCGAANNQLEDPKTDAKRFPKETLYVPDFLANRMGIVNCANEQYGIVENDPFITSHLGREMPTGIYQRCLEIFQRAKDSGRTPVEEAELLADELSVKPHPIWGNRGQVIIDFLVQSGWAAGKPNREVLREL